MKIYTLRVGLAGTSDIWRTIEIKGDQTLDQLHNAIFKAYERCDEHLYAFFLSNKPWDSSSEYGLPDPNGDRKIKNSKRTKIDSIHLQEKKKFLYLFDFGDEWHHPIQVLSIREEEAAGRYPRIVESKGEAPPQYPYLEDEEEEGE